MAKTLPNFGQIAVAARLGWKWAEELRLFVRISPNKGNYKVEIQPPTFKPDPAEDPYHGGHWRAQEGIIYKVPALNKYMGRQKPCIFYIDDDGMEVAAPAVALTQIEEPAPEPKATVVKDEANTSEGENDQTA
jgi:hypothetical protein